MDFLSRMLKGLVVGVANIIPGVSGGTMAVVMGIYDKLIGAVSDLRRDFKNSVIYLFPIGVGALLGILLFSYLIEYLLANFTMPTNIFFLGLILGSIPMIYRRATREKLKKVSLLPFAASFAVMIVMTLLQNVTDAGSALITTLDVGSAIRLFVGGGSGGLHDYAGHQRLDDYGAAGRLHLGADRHLLLQHPGADSGGAGGFAGCVLGRQADRLVHEAV